MTSVTRVMENCPCVASYTGHAIKERLQDEIESSWLHYARKMREKCVQMKLPRNYETQLNCEKDVQETWIRALIKEFRISERPEEMDSKPDRREKATSCLGVHDI